MHPVYRYGKLRIFNTIYCLNITYSYLLLKYENGVTYVSMH